MIDSFAVEWKLQDLPMLMKNLTDLASHHGFLLAVYGSTITRGTGRDLDLLLVQKRPGVSVRDYLETMRRFLGAELMSSSDGIYAVKTELWQWQGHLMDIQVRTAEPLISLFNVQG